VLRTNVKQEGNGEMRLAIVDDYGRELIGMPPEEMVDILTRVMYGNDDTKRKEKMRKRLREAWVFVENALKQRTIYLSNDIDVEGAVEWGKQK
jgi:hypothetical protein